MWLTSTSNQNRLMNLYFVLKRVLLPRFGHHVSNAVIINMFVEEIKRKLVGRQRESDKANMQCRKMSLHG